MHVLLFLVLSWIWYFKMFTYT